jgi:membrane-bound lytic murein transglycosylase D
MDGYVDERRDPVQSSAAAAAYLKDAYQEFGDWLLAIASYNCGRSNVIHAIEKANGASDFWSIRQYLPVETRGYVPAYIAITYLMNYHKKYNIVPQTCNFLVKTDTVSVDKFVSINSVAHCLNIDAAKLAILNPAYSQQIIHATKDAPRILIIPEDAKEKYTTLYASLNSDLTYYAVVAPKVIYTPPPAPVQVAAQPVQTPSEPIQTLQKQPETPQLPVAAPKTTNTVAVIAAQPANKKVTKTYISYRVQPGDTLPVIAQKFEGASVEDIKSLNGLKNEDIQPGMILNISKS